MRNRPALTADDAAVMMAACTAFAAQKTWNVSIAIVDDAGYLLRFERLEGAAPVTAEVAYGKAKAAAITRKPTKELEERVNDRPVFVSFPYPNSLLIQGGLPILVGGEGVGAIGVSGVASHDDEAVAQAGIDALKL